MPNGCNALNLGENAARLQGNEKLHIPKFSDGNPGYFLLDSQTGVEWIYAVAIAETITPLDTKPVAKRLQTLLGETGDPCSLGGPTKGRTEGRLGPRLQRLARESQGKMEWRSLVLIHEGT